jgi:hypothetical protein
VTGGAERTEDKEVTVERQFKSVMGVKDDAVKIEEKEKEGW